MVVSTRVQTPDKNQKNLTVPKHKNPAGSTTNGVSVCGAMGDRTPDLMTASHALSQLSYGPDYETTCAFAARVVAY